MQSFQAKGQDGVRPARREDAFEAGEAGGRGDLHGRGREGGDLLLHALGEALVHGGTPRDHHVGVQVLADVHVALHDAAPYRAHFIMPQDLMALPLSPSRTQ